MRGKLEEICKKNLRILCQEEDYVRRGSVWKDEWKTNDR